MGVLECDLSATFISLVQSLNFESRSSNHDSNNSIDRFKVYKVYKPTNRSHVQMSLVFSENGLDDIRPPCVAQTFINHSAKLYKLFVLKKQYFMVERPSLKNFEAGGEWAIVHKFSNEINSKTNKTPKRNPQMNFPNLHRLTCCHHPQTFPPCTSTRIKSQRWTPPAN